MPGRQQLVVAAAQRAADQRREIGSQVRSARAAAGISLHALGLAIGRSEAWLSRVERGLLPGVAFDELVVLAAAAGLRVRLSAWPDAPAVRDVGQLRVLERARTAFGAGWTWQLEVPIPIRGDRRAVDAVVRSADRKAAIVEAITRVEDVQAQLRSIALKARDLEIGRTIIVVSGTLRNRARLTAAHGPLAAVFDLDTRRVLHGMRSGRLPARDAIIFL